MAERDEKKDAEPYEEVPYPFPPSGATTSSLSTEAKATSRPDVLSERTGQTTRARDGLDTIPGDASSSLERTNPANEDSFSDGESGALDLEKQSAEQDTTDVHPRDYEASRDLKEQIDPSNTGPDESLVTDHQISSVGDLSPDSEPTMQQTSRNLEPIIVGAVRIHGPDYQPGVSGLVSEVHDEPAAPVSGRSMRSGTTTATNTPLQAVLVDEDLAQENRFSEQEVREIIRRVTLDASDSNGTHRHQQLDVFSRKGGTVLVVSIMVVIGIIVGVVVGRQNDSSPSTETGILQDSPNDPPQNVEPVARCLPEVFVSSNAACGLDSLDPKLLDNDSFDRSGSDLKYEVQYVGSLHVGVHRVTLIVENDDGLRSACSTNVVVGDNAAESTSWVQFGRSIYRVRQCTSDWFGSVELTSRTSVCGRPAHAVTITSQEENDFLGSFTLVDRFWTGAFQPTSAVEPDRGWEWVTEENFYGFASWNQGEPNQGNSREEDCMDFYPELGGWNDAFCYTQSPFMEEVDLDVLTVVTSDGCDSGVVDVFDVDSCSLVITQRIADCEVEAMGANCLEPFLQSLVDEGNLTQGDKEAILYCGAENQVPVAVCKEALTIHATTCDGVEIEASLLDNGSFDPDNDTLRFLLSEEQIAVGPNTTVSLTVEDGRGGSASCQTLISVVDGGRNDTASEWVSYRNHAYRLRYCKSDWNNAVTTVSKTPNLCPQLQTGSSHLATITSQGEAEFLNRVGSLIPPQFLWVGGFQPPNAREPDGGWSWVNNEGLLNETFEDWLEGEPNQEGENEEDCLATRSGLFRENWIDGDCKSINSFVEEVEFTERTVTWNSCDSGVQDLVDPGTCSYRIANEMDRCELEMAEVQEFVTCVQNFLSGLVVIAALELGEAERVGECLVMR